MIGYRALARGLISGSLLCFVHAAALAQTEVTPALEVVGQPDEPRGDQAAAKVTKPPVSPSIDIRRLYSSQGIELLYLHAPGLPMVDLAIDIDAGSRWDPMGHEGLAAFTGDLVGKGLAQRDDRPAMSEQQVREAFAKLAIQRSVSVDRDRTSLRFRFLTTPETYGASRDLIARMIAEPSFSPEVLSRDRGLSIAGLQESLTRPQTLATRSLWAAMYPDHPYGRASTEASLGSLTRALVHAFHSRFWRPERMTATIVGDVSEAEALSLLNSVTALIGRAPADATAPAKAEGAGAASSQAVQWLDLLPSVGPGQPGQKTIAHPAKQSHIWLGAPMMSRRDRDDYFPMLVANHILGGGGFTARLTTEVREKRGLSYSVFSAFQPLAQTGPFLIGLQTQRERANEALAVVQATLKEFVEKGPSPEELEAAKKNLMGGFALRLDSNRKLLDNLAQIGFYRLPLDYLDRWSARVEAVNAEEIQDVLRRRLSPSSLSIVVVGEPTTKSQ